MAISVKVVKGRGEAEMTPIRDQLISTEWIAVKRGSIELWKSYYTRTTRSVLVPYGATLDDDLVGAVVPELPSGIHLVRAVEISIEDPSGKIVEKLDLEGEYIDPEA